MIIHATNLPQIKSSLQNKINYKRNKENKSYLFIVALLKYIKIIKKYMLQVNSPFVENIEECKSAMKKLRKKIYKYTTTHKQAKRPKDSAQDILGLLQPRGLPKFLLDPIKKRRNFDISSLKSVMALPGATLQQITARTNNQEDQIKNLFKEHKQHKQKLQSERKPTTPKFDRKWTVSTEVIEREKSLSLYEQSYISREDDYANFLNPEVSEFRMMEDVENENMDFFRNYDLNFIGHSLFEDDDN